MRGKKVLIIEDDPGTLHFLAHVFKREGAIVSTALDGQEGLRQFYTQRPDLIILDIMLPKMDGLETCSRILQLDDVPIILATALAQDRNVIEGLDCGAVDYIIKPFNKDVLLARARAALRRLTRRPEPSPQITYADDYLVIDLNHHRVLVRGEPVRLTGLEYRLLAYLVEHAGLILTSHQILEKVWGWEYRDSIDYVHVHISHLRRKLEEDPRQPKYILTEYGIGYRFEKNN